MINFVGRLFVPLLVLVYCIGFLWSLAQMRLGANAYPYVVVGALLLTSVVCLSVEVVSWRAEQGAGISSGEAPGSKVQRPGSKQAWVKWRGLVWTVGLLVAYVIVIPTLGYEIASVAFVGVLAWALRVRDWRLLLALAMGAGVLGYVLFDVLLAVPLPDGLLDPR